MPGMSGDLGEISQSNLHKFEQKIKFRSELLQSNFQG